jgi:3-oxoadipate enol-lactonase
MPSPVDVKRGPFAWREAGTDAPVLLLHGLGGSRLSWEPQLGHLGTHRTVAWEMPGYGESDPLPDHPLTFAAVADAAARCIEALGHERAHVVGISMGGMIAQYLAAHHPHRVRSLVLLSSSPAFGLDGTSPADWTTRRLAPLDQGLQPADYAERVVRLLGGAGITPEAVAQQCAAMARISADALRRSIAMIVTHDSRPLLGSIVAPTLVMVGSDDAETPPEYSHHLAQHIPHATLAVVPGVGHLLNAEAPDLVNELITEHLRTVETLEGQ